MWVSKGSRKESRDNSVLWKSFERQMYAMRNTRKKLVVVLCTNWYIEDVRSNRCNLARSKRGNWGDSGIVVIRLSKHDCEAFWRLVYDLICRKLHFVSVTTVSNVISVCNGESACNSSPPTVNTSDPFDPGVLEQASIRRTRIMIRRLKHSGTSCHRRRKWEGCLSRGGGMWGREGHSLKILQLAYFLIQLYIPWNIRLLFSIDW